MGKHATPDGEIEGQLRAYRAQALAETWAEVTSCLAAAMARAARELGVQVRFPPKRAGRRPPQRAKRAPVPPPPRITGKPKGRPPSRAPEVEALVAAGTERPGDIAAALGCSFQAAKSALQKVRQKRRAVEAQAPAPSEEPAPEPAPAPRPVAPAPSSAPLKPKERAVLEMDAAGKSNAEIRAELGLKAGTLGAIRARARKKVGLPPARNGRPPKQKAAPLPPPAPPRPAPINAIARAAELVGEGETAPTVIAKRGGISRAAAMIALSRSRQRAWRAPAAPAETVDDRAERRAAMDEIAALASCDEPAPPAAPSEIEETAAEPAPGAVPAYTTEDRTAAAQRGLSKRQAEVWALHEKGRTPAQIAADLGGLSFSAVAYHLYQAKRRLGLDTKRAATYAPRSSAPKLGRDDAQVRLRTEPAKHDGHTHVAEMSSEGGYGQTTPGPDGHWHPITEFEVQKFRGHAHDLSSERC